MTTTSDLSDRIAPMLKRIVHVERAEVSALLLSFAYFFAVLCAYYIIRPVRDAMGTMVGKDALQSLFVIVFLVMIAAVPVFGWVVKTFERRHVVPIVYAFFIANLVVFWMVLSGGAPSRTVAGAFFVWVSVFNLFVVSVFWSLMSDLYASHQAQRLYGFIAAGGSAGAFVGPFITQGLVKLIGTASLLLVSALFLLLALACVFALRHAVPGAERQSAAGEAKEDHGVLAGAQRVLTSPYLLRIALWVLLANVVSTFFYFEQARIVGETYASAEDRVQVFARMDLAVSVLTILAQVLLTGRVMERIGPGYAAAALPLVCMLGLAALSVAPVLSVIVVVMVAERAIAFALANPALRVFYTVVPAEDKYKAQNFIDTVVYRGGDAASSWVIDGLAKGLGLGSTAAALIALPFAAVWLYLSFALGRQQAVPEREPGA